MKDEQDAAVAGEEAEGCSDEYEVWELKVGEMWNLEDCLLQGNHQMHQNLEAGLDHQG